MNLAIIKYTAGNIQSVLYALERLGVQAEVTDDAEKIRRADKVIFPGVGEASTAMQSLRQNGLDQVIRDLKQPVFGICVGMQLLCAHSEENNTDCLGIVPVWVKKFQQPQADLGEAADERLKVPQMGWNKIFNLQSPLFRNVPENSFIYNVHSYFVEENEHAIATCQYGIRYAAAIRKNNFYGVQFHTEKSAAVGDQILKNFVELPV